MWRAAISFEECLAGELEMVISPTRQSRAENPVSSIDRKRRSLCELDWWAQRRVESFIVIYFVFWLI